MRNGYSTGLLVVCLVSFLACNPQNQFKNLENEVNDLKIEIFRQRQEIQELVKKAEQEEKNSAADRTRDNQFRADTQETLRQIKEHVQTTSNKLNSGTQQRSNTTPVAPPPSTKPPVEISTLPAQIEPDQQQLVMANKDFNIGNYSGAVDATDNLIKYFPDSERVPDALYLKGRALMAMRSFADAQESFQQICTKYPESNLFRQARLNIGRCQHAQGNTMAAIATLQDIVDRYPSSPEARQASEILQDVKTGR